MKRCSSVLEKYKLNHTFSLIRLAMIKLSGTQYNIGVGKHMLIPTHCWWGCGQVQTICRAIYYDLPKITNAHTL